MAAEAFGVATGVATVVELFAKVCVLCSHYCADVRNAPRDVRLLLREADHLSATLSDAHRLLSGPNGAKAHDTPNLARGVDECHALLVELATRLVQGLGSGRVLWPFKKNEITQIIARLERCKAKVQLDIGVKQA